MCRDGGVTADLLLSVGPRGKGGRASLRIRDYLDAVGSTTTAGAVRTDQEPPAKQRRAASAPLVGGAAALESNLMASPCPPPGNGEAGTQHNPSAALRRVATQGDALTFVDDDQVGAVTH